LRGKKEHERERKAELEENCRNKSEFKKKNTENARNRTENMENEWKKGTTRTKPAKKKRKLKCFSISPKIATIFGFRQSVVKKHLAWTVKLIEDAMSRLNFQCSLVCGQVH
jgi:chromatin remodeling complex protein RSC6